ncbi:probable F420-dependent oxidoreductase, Rv1855c family [Georgenia satyanarayanai]|uniref:Probable F420-dependent oxidoreductase, Rv1855c family n=1 Tax=Georgenia satyanarayanai TaxID=860221 RepID=A0A2Y9ASV4_9MICO|nr:LLM class F420-dependent oxidoreductase [Georgenia satyanarayanai]PYF97807.1 F420-dependent oxidoreductase-like protein [Georgenia satyanarayanai]SSA45547.1 probable F420-dependent oxidoreductase, Rv1855c family [Georgenia satyanarayanai]
MDLRIFTEPQQGASYADQLAMAQRAEQLGFSAFFRSDHYLRMGDGDPMPGPTDAWTTLAGLARETSTIRLGTLVTSATFRLPGVLAIQVAQVDDMSGGRVEFGLGTGWFEEEHRAYGIPFPDRRFGLLTEQLEVLTGLWSTPAGETFSHDGEHYTLVDSPALPKPVQDRVPVVVGGNGPRRTPALAARFATEYNQAFPEKATIAAQRDRVRAACEAVDRDPDELVYSVALIADVGRDEQEVARRAATIGREPEELRRNGLAGTPQEVLDGLGALAEQGITRVYLQCMDMTDLDHLDLIAAEVMGQLDTGA